MSASEIFQAFWHGRPLPLLQWACLRSFIANGHRLHLYTYDPIEVPLGVERLAADEVIPRSEIFYFNNDGNNIPTDISPFSDYFRFRLLLERGGWYIDTDVICNTTAFPACTHAWAQELPEMVPHKFGTSQIKFPADDPLMERLDHECGQLRHTFKIREDLGPNLLSRVLGESPVPPGHMGEADTFYPLRWIETYKLWLPSYRDEIATECRDALFINCYNSLFSYMKLSSAGLPPKGSFLMDLYERLCPDRIEGPVLTQREVFRLTHNFFAERDWAREELSIVSGPAALAAVESLGAP
jgi:hypothetical protein